MLPLFPFAAWLGWLAVAVSVVVLVMLVTAGELGPRGAVITVSWLLVAGYCQFFTTSASAIGLALQTLLAIGLITRWRLTT